MKIKTLILSMALSFFTANCFAANIDQWIYKEVTGNLKSSPGCKSKEKAMKTAVKPVRFKKYTQLLCQNIAYGWALAEVLDRGTMVCDSCSTGEDDDEYANKYRCRAVNVKVKCKQVVR